MELAFAILPSERDISDIQDEDVTDDAFKMRTSFQQGIASETLIMFQDVKDMENPTHQFSI